MDLSESKLPQSLLRMEEEEKGALGRMDAFWTN